MVQLYADKSVSSLKRNAVIPYPLHVVFLNFTLKVRRFLIAHGYTFAELLSKSTTDADLNEQKQMLEFFLKLRFRFSIWASFLSASFKDARIIGLTMVYKKMQKITEAVIGCVQYEFLCLFAVKHGSCTQLWFRTSVLSLRRNKRLKWNLVQQLIRAFNVWYQNTIFMSKVFVQND